MIVAVDTFHHREFPGAPKRGVTVYATGDAYDYSGPDSVAELTERAYQNSSGRSRDTRRGLEVRFDFDAYQ